MRAAAIGDTATGAATATATGGGSPSLMGKGAVDDAVGGSAVGFVGSLRMRDGTSSLGA